MRCVICGKELKRLTLSHVNTHSMDMSGYNRRRAMLSEEAWEFYWTHPKLRRQFPSPIATRAKAGRLTYRQYTQLPKIQKRHPELVAVEEEG
jgi:hypothetical protein